MPETIDNTFMDMWFVDLWCDRCCEEGFNDT